MDDVAGGKMEQDLNYAALTRRLGWVSAYARKVLLGRHFLRCLWVAGEHTDFYSDHRDQWLLGVLRALLCSQQLNARSQNSISTPYYPHNRPTLFSIAMRGRQTVLTIVSDRSIPATIFSNFKEGNESLFSRALHEAIKNSDYQLALEIANATRSTNLSTKSVVDDRCKKLVQKS